MKYYKLTTIFFLVLIISLMTTSVAVAASPLTKPKTDGLIGEQANGYIGLVAQNVPADVRKLVDEANANRRAGYKKIAAGEGANLEDVERVGGNTAMNRTLSGNYIRDDSGTWRKK